MQFLRNAVEIAIESFLYRLRKREANNLLATLSLLLVFEVRGVDLGLRAVFAVLLNFFIYLSNDYCDLEFDLDDADKSRSKTRFMAEHHRAAGFAVLAELALLVGVAAVHAVLFRSPLLAIALVLNVAGYHGYSRWLKRAPIIDVVAMTVAGASSTMVGAPATPEGYQLLGLLALFSGCFELIQVLRDIDSDRQQGVRTTAVLLGPRATAWVFRAFVLAAAGLGVLVLGRRAAAGLLLALVLPLEPDRAARSWDWARLIFGLSWLGILAEVFLQR